MAAEQDPENPAWRVFVGDGVVRPDTPLPEAPPWRRFPVPAARPAYRPYPRLVNAVNVAISLRRPLLLTGPAGIGKSSVAEAIAHELDVGPVLRWNVTSRSTLEEGLYRYDALGRLRHQQLGRLRQQPGRALQPSGGTADAIEDFLRLGPLGTALISGRRRVLLVDELDKGDIDLPGDLLNVLERGEFEIPELVRHAGSVRLRAADGDETFPVERGAVSCSVFPIIVLTSNGEREFPPAFLRRCIREQVEVPGPERLAEIVAAHLGADLAGRADALIRDFAARIGSPDRPAALAVDQLLNTVLLMTRDDAPTGEQRAEMLELMQKELRES